MAKESRSICRRFCGALKAFAIGAAIALTGAAWGATQKIGTQTWTYDLVIEGGATAWSTLQALGWTQFRIVGEVAPGVVQMLADGGTIVTLKPGSYPWGGLF